VFGIYGDLKISVININIWKFIIYINVPSIINTRSKLQIFKNVVKLALRNIVPNNFNNSETILVCILNEVLQGF